MKRFEIHIKHRVAQVKEKLPTFIGEKFIQDPNIHLMFLATAILFITCWAFAVLRFKPSEFSVPVRYDSFLGVTQLGEWYELYRIPLIMTICVFINLVLANIIYRRDRMISYIFVSANIFLTIIALVNVINFSVLLGQ